MSVAAATDGRSPAGAVRAELLARRLARRRSGAAHVAESLVRSGVTHVFCVGGAPIDPVVSACGTVGLRLIGCRHQTAAGMMSLAFNFVSGSLRSAVLVSGGPAATNLSTAVLFAYDNAWPLLVIAGRFAAPGSPSGRLVGAFQRLDAAAMHAPICRWTGLVSHASQAAAVIATAAAAAGGRQPGPVFVDLAAEAIREVDIAAAGSARPQVVEKVADRPFDDALRLLREARRPVLLIGDGLRWSAPWTALERLVGDNGIVFAASPMARGFVSDDHPLCRTHQRASVLASADVVLVAGARLDWSFRHGAEVAPDARLIRLAADDRADDAAGDRADDAAGVAPALQAAAAAAVVLPGDAGAALARIADGLDVARRTFSSPDPQPPEAASEPQSQAASPAVEPRAGGSGLSPRAWLVEAARALPDAAITVLDGNVVMTLAQRILPVRLPATRLTPGANGTMGVGVPFAIGAKLARPDLPVVVFTGDFAIGTQLAELETAVRHRVGITVVVSNNAGAGGSTRQQTFLPEHPEAVFSFSTEVRYDRVAEALGCAGESVESIGALAPALGAAIRRAQHDAMPTCIDVRSARDVPVAASI